MIVNINDGCPECGGALIPYVDNDTSCTCFINPPCSKCTDSRLICVDCGFIDKPYDDILKYTGAIFEYTYKPLDASKIDYKLKSSGGWVEATGVYPDGTTIMDVKNKLGKFDKYHLFKFKSFGNGRFCASWCTD